VTSEQQLRAYHTLDELQSLRSDWDRLLLKYPRATTFSTYDWLANWWRSFGDRRQLLVLALFDSDSLVGLAPLSISRERFAGFHIRVLRMMGDGTYDSDNLDFPAQVGYENILADAVLKYLMQFKDSWDVCVLNTLPPDSVPAKCVAERLKTREWMSFEHSTPSSSIELPATWEEYRVRLSAEDQKNLPRYLRRLRKHYGVRIYRCAESKDLPMCLETLFRLHQARWEKVGQPGSFSSSERRDFYAALSRCLLLSGALEFWILELDGKIAAAQFAFRYRDRVFQLQEGYDPEHSSDRVGYVLRGEVLKRLVSEGVRVYDFLGGEDSYKSRWGAKTGCYHEFHFARPFTFGGALLWSSERAREYKRSLRENFPEAVRFLRNAKRTIQERALPAGSIPGNSSRDLDRSAQDPARGEMPEHGAEVA
jgi:CelD/BcsL family acetyltransferase involved in cellulose biosynthesis